MAVYLWCKNSDSMILWWVYLWLFIHCKCFIVFLFFPNVQPESPPMQLEAALSNPISGYVGEEASPRLTTTHSDTSPVPSGAPCVRLVLQTPHQPHCLPLNMIQGHSVFLVERNPKLNTVLKIWSSLAFMYHSEWLILFWTWILYKIPDGNNFYSFGVSLKSTYIYTRLCVWAIWST